MSLSIFYILNLQTLGPGDKSQIIQRKIYRKYRQKTLGPGDETLETLGPGDKS